MAAITGTTESGFRYTLPPDALDDYELLENLCDIDNGDVSKITGTARQLLGDAQIEALKDHVRKENGRVADAIWSSPPDPVFSINTYSFPRLSSSSNLTGIPRLDCR